MIIIGGRGGGETKIISVGRGKGRKTLRGKGEQLQFFLPLPFLLTLAIRHKSYKFPQEG